MPKRLIHALRRGTPNLAPAAIRAAALAVLIALPAAVDAQLNQTMHHDGWILAAAHAPGAHGSIWRTDLWAHMKGSGPVTMTLTLIRSGQDGTNAPRFELEFPANEATVHIEDVVDHFLDVGDGSWVGAIHYTAPALVQVYARVYSISADGSASYGQVIEGIPTVDMSIPVADPNYENSWGDQWMFAMKHTADGRYRVNIGMVNPTAVPTTFDVAIFDETTDVPPGWDNDIEVQMPPFSMVQLSDPFGGVTGGEWSENIVRVRALELGSGAFAYASVVDNATNDAYFVRGVKGLRPDQ